MNTTMQDTRPLSTTIFLTRSQYIYLGPEQIRLTPSGVAAIPARRVAEAIADAQRIPYEVEQEDSWYGERFHQREMTFHPFTEVSHHNILVCEVKARRATYEIWATAYVLPPYSTLDPHEVPMEHRLVRFDGQMMAPLDAR